MQGILYITSNIIKTHCHCFSLVTSETPTWVFQRDSEGCLQGVPEVWLDYEETQPEANSESEACRIQKKDG